MGTPCPNKALKFSGNSSVPCYNSACVPLFDNPLNIVANHFLPAIKTGPGSVPTRTRFGTKTDPVGYQSGPAKDPIGTRKGPGLNPAQIP